MTEEKIKALVAKLRKLVPARGEWTTLAEAACGDAADALEDMLSKSVTTDEQKLMAFEDRALELTVEYAPKHEYRDPDSGNQCFSALGFARDLLKALTVEPEGWKLMPVVMTADMINAWSGGKTVTSDNVAARTTFQDAWKRVLAATPKPTGV
jgi:hypothetical protein